VDLVVVTTGRCGPSSGDAREDGVVPGRGGDGWVVWTQTTVTARRMTRFPGMVVTAERTMRFPGTTTMATTVEAVEEADGEVAVWYRWWRRSGMAQFLIAVMAWRRSGRWCRGLDGGGGVGRYGSRAP
jgi:hypothetical protein